AVSGLGSGVAAVVTGDSFSCALTTGGAVSCWGDNSKGQLGDTTVTQRHTPVGVSGLSSGVTAIAANGKHACAITGGALMCWGENNKGQVGDGTVTERHAPVAVSGLGSGVTSVSAGDLPACAVASGAA